MTEVELNEIVACLELLFQVDDMARGLSDDADWRRVVELLDQLQK